MGNVVKMKVLIADDEPGVRRLLRETLSGEYRVVEAQNGREAIEMVMAERPDIVLLDMIMPEMDGLSACSVIKNAAATKAIPVIMISAITYELNKKLAEKGAGASAYITKPFSPNEVRETVASALSGERVACDPAMPTATR